MVNDAQKRVTFSCELSADAARLIAATLLFFVESRSATGSLSMEVTDGDGRVQIIATYGPAFERDPTFKAMCAELLRLLGPNGVAHDDSGAWPLDVWERNIRKHDAITRAAKAGGLHAAALRAELLVQLEVDPDAVRDALASAHPDIIAYADLLRGGALSNDDAARALTMDRDRVDDAQVGLRILLGTLNR